MKRTPLLIEQRQGTKTLWIFDMDGTLLLSPEPHWGLSLWEKVKGSPWPHGESWWSRPETLLPPFPIRAIGSTLRAFANAKRQNGKVIVMTGRKDSPAMRRAVKSALRKGGVTGYNALYLKPPSAPSTGAWKVAMIQALARKYPGLESIFMWDDRIDHVREFEQTIKGLGLNGSVTYVNDPAWGSNMPDTT